MGDKGEENETSLNEPKSDKIFLKALIVAFLAYVFLVFTFSFLLFFLQPVIPSYFLKNHGFEIMFLGPIIPCIIIYLYIMGESPSKEPDMSSESKVAGKPPANTTLTCKHGHTVPVWFNYDGQYYGGSVLSDKVSQANVWPKRCPICGAHWRMPELEND